MGNMGLTNLSPASDMVSECLSHQFLEQIVGCMSVTSGDSAAQI
jgi:hypothetical protein